MSIDSCARISGIVIVMADEEKDAAAQSMAAKRWAKTTQKERSEVARKLNEARWGKKGSRKKKKA